jgi:A/G-specific adenine glycosylase
MNKKEKEFIKTVWEYYKAHGRQSLPWRQTQNPYHILVSEIMLQQTQVDRVIPRYKRFLKKFPTLKKLSEASLGDVLREWQGLGYNRRAKMLHQCATTILTQYKGKFPKTHTELMQLPGIGHYTAGAIMAFAYNVGVPIIETNIRSVFIHHFHKDQTDVTDTELFHSIGIVLDTENPREWYYALMDYGAYLKKTIGNPNSRSKHFAVQSTFKNSDRQIRGAIVKFLAEKEQSRNELCKKLSFDIQRIDEQVEKLLKEGMIAKKNQKYKLP